MLTEKLKAWEAQIFSILNQATVSEPKTEQALSTSNGTKAACQIAASIHNSGEKRPVSPRREDRQAMISKNFVDENLVTPIQPRQNPTLPEIPKLVSTTGNLQFMGGLMNHPDVTDGTKQEIPEISAQGGQKASEPPIPGQRSDAAFPNAPGKPSQSQGSIEVYAEENLTLLKKRGYKKQHRIQ